MLRYCKIKRMLIGFMIFTLLLGCFGLDSYAATKVSKLTFTNVGSRKTLKKGETFKLKYSITSKATNKKVIFKSSKSSVVSVTSKGTLKAKKKGTAYIRVKALDGSKKYDRVKVTVGTKVTSVTRVKFPSKKTLKKGTSYAMKVSVKPTKASYKGITWSSSNKKVATVTSKGVVCAVGPGTTTIKAKAADGSGKYRTCKVTVPAVKVTAVSMVNGVSKIIYGDKKQFGVSVSPSNADNKSVTWSSSNTKVATVDAYGKITTKGAGSTTIKATAKDGSGKYASYNVTVHKILSTSTKFIAHRGLSSEEPENTLPSFKKASKYKFWGIETDVYESNVSWNKPIAGAASPSKTEKYNDIMVMHDDTTTRMCDKSTSIYNINSKNRDSYPVTKGNGNVYGNTLKIPTIEEFLDPDQSIGTKVPIIELKDENMSTKGMDRIIEVLGEEKIKEAVIISFKKPLLEDFKSEVTQIGSTSSVDFTYMYVKDSSTLSSETVTQAMAYCKAQGFEILSLSKSLVTKNVVTKAHNDNLEICVWTINDQIEALDYLDMGVDYLTTNEKLFTD